MTRTWYLVAVLLLAPAVLAADQKKKDEQQVQAQGGADNYDEIVARYLMEAREAASAPPRPGAWMSSLAGDIRARQVNDLVTVRVEEAIVAAGSANSSLSKESGMSAGVGSFFGVESFLPGRIDPGNLAQGSAGTDFKGGGRTARTGALSAVMTARVAEVLPNGDLVIEGVREIEINGDRQIIVLTGVARWMDIRPGNVLSSASIGQLRIRYFGRGLMRDNLSPGWLVRILNKIF